jgi:hypothetical protein
MLDYLKVVVLYYWQSYKGRGEGGVVGKCFELSAHAHDGGYSSMMKFGTSWSV